MRLPGVEPGSIAWKAIILTVGLQTLLTKAHLQYFHSCGIQHSTLPQSPQSKLKSMEITKPLHNPIQFPPPPLFPNKKHTPSRTPNSIHFKSNDNAIPTPQNQRSKSNNPEKSMPTMSDIIDSSRAQKLDIQLQTLGPFFRITARSSETGAELGRAEGVIRVWFGGRILHLDSMKLRRETIGMEKSIFGIGLFIGAVAIRFGYDCGCGKAELLAINDTELYHSKLVRFYKRLGFKEVHEVTGSTLGDLSHMLVWGGVGTRMDADIENLMIKWCSSPLQ